MTVRVGLALLLLAATARADDAEAVPPFLAPAALPAWAGRLLGAGEPTSTGAVRLELGAASIGYSWMHADGVTAVGALDDGGALSACVGGQLYRWDARGRLLWSRTLPEGTWPDLAVDASGQTALLSTHDGLRLLDVATGKDRRSPLPGRLPKRVEMDPTGRRALAVRDDGQVSLWDLAAGSERVLHPIEADREVRAWSCALSADGTTAAASFIDGRVRVWRVDEATAPRSWQAHLPNGPGNEGGARSIALDRDGGRLLTGGGYQDPVVRLWDPRTGAQVWEAPRTHEHLVSVVRFAPDDRHALSASFDGTMVLWDVEARRKAHDLVGHCARVYAARFSPDGRRIVSSGGDERVLAWDVATGRLLPGPRRRTIGELALAPDGRHLLTACNDGRAERWDLERGEGRVALAVDGETVHDVAAGRDGTVVVGTTRGAWVTRGEGPPRRLEGADETFGVAVLGTGELLTVGRRGALLRFAPDGTGGAPLLGTQDITRCLAVGPDDTRLLLGTQTDLQLWRLRPGTLEASRERVAATPTIRVALSADGRRAVLGWNDAALLDVDTGKRTPLPSGAWPVAVTPDGRRAVTSTAAGDLILWDVAGARELARVALSAGHDRASSAIFHTNDVLFVGTCRGALLRFRVVE